MLPFPPEIPAFFWHTACFAIRQAKSVSALMEGMMTAMMDTHSGKGRRAGERRGDNVIPMPLPLPAEADRQHLVDWALATVAAAEQRLAALQERVNYLESLSVTDELTGLLNRRGFLGELERALATAKRGGPGGVLMVCDLDGFKLVNDRFGHGAGNDTLRSFAQLIAGKVRRNDTVGRLGGDEFGIILAGANLGNARRKAAAMTQLVATTPFCWEAQAIDLGVSFGLALYGGAETEEELLHRADLAMYAEKRRSAKSRPA
jgi:diguanylate cyclase (GGDEF)-like protein